MANGVKNILFRFKWLLMPREARYAYLWNKTRSGYEDRITRGIY